MALFELKDIKLPQPQSRAAAKGIEGAFHAVSSLKNKEIEEAIGRVEKSTAYMSKGAFSQHELLTYLLTLSGPADLWLCTWGLSPEPVARLHELKTSGMLKSIRAVLDFRIRERNPEALQRLSALADDIALVKSHAKVLPIRGEREGFTVISSANFTKNPRMEAGVIIKGGEFTESQIEWIQKELDGGTKPSNK